MIGTMTLFCNIARQPVSKLPLTCGVFLITFADVSTIINLPNSCKCNAGVYANCDMNGG